MGAGCSNCFLGLPCVEAECATADMATVSADVVARLKGADADLRRDERYSQRLSELQASFARERRLCPEEVARQAAAIRAMYRARRTLEKYAPSRDSVRLCFEAPLPPATSRALECHDAVRSLCDVADAGPDGARRTPSRRCSNLTCSEALLRKLRRQQQQQQQQAAPDSDDSRNDEKDSSNGQ